MSLFDQWPYTNFHELNLDWILESLRVLEHTIDQFVAINALKYADPIQWNIVSQYEKNTIVIDPLTGTAYISVQPVPSGVALTRDEYWTVVFDLGSFVVRAAKNFTDRWESQWTLTATFPSNTGDWLVWNDTLYKVMSNIVAGDQYVVDSNIKHFTMEDTIGHLEDLNTTDKSSIVAALNEVAAEVLGKIGDLADLNTTDKSTIVNAINEVLSTALTNSENIRYNITRFINVVDPNTGLVTVNIPKDSIFWLPSNILAIALTAINVGDTLTDNVNYNPCSLESLMRFIITFNNVVAKGGVRVEGSLEVVTNADIDGNLNVDGNATIGSNLAVTGNLKYGTPTPISGTRSVVGAKDASDNSYNLLSVNPAGDITILLADSTETHTGYGEKYRQIAGIPSANFVNLAADSSNIAAGLWRGFLTSWCNNHPNDLIRVKTVIASGGGNDSSDSALSTLDTEIKNLCDYVHANLPNATIYFAYNAFFLAKSAILNGRDWWRRLQAESIWSKCGKYGGVYLDTKAVLHNWDFWDASTDGVHPDVDSADAIAATLYTSINGGCPYIDYKLYSPIAFELLAANASVTQGDVVEYMQGNMVFLSFNDVIIESTNSSPFFTVQNGAQSLAKYLGHFTCGSEVTGTTFFIAIEDANNNEYANVPCTLSLTGNPNDGYKQYMAFYFRDLDRGYTCTKLRLNGVVSVPVMRM